MKTLALALPILLLTSMHASADPATATTASAQLAWPDDEATHARLLKQGLNGKALGALEALLASESFHVVRTRLVMNNTAAAPTLRQGALTIQYQATVAEPACPDGAPCRRASPQQVIVEIACDQPVSPGVELAPSCDIVRGVRFTSQQLR